MFFIVRLTSNPSSQTKAFSWGLYLRITSKISEKYAHWKQYYHWTLSILVLILDGLVNCSKETAMLRYWT